MIANVVNKLYIAFEFYILYRKIKSTQEGSMIKEGIIKRIHVNQHHIKANAKDDGKRPVLTIKTSKENVTCNAVNINGPSKLVYSKDKPLSCGAKVWIETTSQVSYQ